MTTKEAADRVLAEMVRESPTYGFDPKIIMVILEALMELLPQLFEMCEMSAAEIKGFCHEAEAGGMAKRIARRNVRRAVGWKNYYAAGGDRLLGGLLKAGCSLTEEEITSVYYELAE